MAHDGKKGGLGLRGCLSRDQREVEVLILLLKLLRVAVRFGLRPFPFDELSDLAADSDENLQQIIIRAADLMSARVSDSASIRVTL